MPKAAPKALAEPTSYESALQELEQLIAQIESGPVSYTHLTLPTTPYV